MSTWVIPSVLTELDIGMVEPAILTEETGGSEIECCQVENQTLASDLSGLSARPLRQNQ